MQPHQTLRQRQAEAGTLGAAGAAGIDLGERLERQHDLFMGHADAGIGHRDGDAAIGGGTRQHQDAAARRRELAGVREQVDQNLAHALVIDLKLRRHALAAHVQHLVLFGEQRRDLIHRRRHRLGDSGGGAGQRQATRFQPGHVQHVADHIEQTAAGPGDMAGIFGAVARGGGAGLTHQVGEADDGVQRRAQFMAHGRKEGRLGAVVQLGFLAGGADGGFGVPAQHHLAQGFGVPREQAGLLTPHRMQTRHVARQRHATIPSKPLDASGKGVQAGLRARPDDTTLGL